MRTAALLLSVVLASCAMAVDYTNLVGDPGFESGVAGPFPPVQGQWTAILSGGPTQDKHRTGAWSWTFGTSLAQGVVQPIDAPPLEMFQRFLVRFYLQLQSTIPAGDYVRVELYANFSGGQIAGNSLRIYGDGTVQVVDHLGIVVSTTPGTPAINKFKEYSLYMVVTNPQPAEPVLAFVQQDTGSPSPQWTGWIDDVEVYADVLSAEERYMTDVQIANMALGHIAIRRPIASLSDTHADAVQCNLHFENARETALCRVDWPFARRKMALVTHAGTPPDPWAYQYDYPADCLRPLRIDDGLDQRASDSRIPFVQVSDSTGARLIYTNVEAAELWYTHRLTDPAKFTPGFSQYLSRLLASRIAAVLTGDEKVAGMQAEAAEMEFGEAFSIDARSEQEPAPLQSSWDSVR